jgi:proteasome lid subunit RPN8/RPN11
MWLSESAAAAVVDAADGHHPDEIGGVLLGVSVARRPWATRAVVVPTARPSRTYYELPKGARPATVDAARRDDPRLGYVGDWHTHPFDMGPSGTDLATMRALARDASSVRPVLIIARCVGHRYRLDAWQFPGPSPRRLRLVAAGELAPVPEPID